MNILKNLKFLEVNIKHTKLFFNEAQKIISNLWFRIYSDIRWYFYDFLEQYKIMGTKLKEVHNQAKEKWNIDEQMHDMQGMLCDYLSTFLVRLDIYVEESNAQNRYMVVVINSIVGFFVLRFLHGMSTGFKPTGTATYMADIVPVNKRGEAMGLLGVFLSLGMTAGLSIGSLIAQEFSLDVMFYTSGVFGILSVLILAGMKESLEEPQKFSFKLFNIKWVDVLEPRVIKPSIVMALTSFSFGIILTVIPDFTEYLGIKNKGLFFTSFTLASLLIRLVAGKVSDAKGRVFVLRLSTILIAIAMALVAYSTAYSHFITASIVFGVAIGMNSPTLFAWAVDLSDEKFRGRSMSTIFISLEIGIGVGAVLSGWLYGNDSDNFRITFLAGAAIAVIAFIYASITKNTIPEFIKED